MACPPSKVKFQFRRDTLVNWSTSDPVLLAGEPAFESDTNSFKIGDGITKWNSLPYLQSPLVFTKNGNVRTLTGYKESGKVLGVRSTDLIGDMLNINLASFSPTLVAQGIPSSSLNWDVACSGFLVSVTNPSDYTSEYISAVASTSLISGIFGLLINFTASPKSNVPAGGISWTQLFSTNSSATIQPISTTIAGGVASCNITFNTVANTVTSIYPTSIPLTINWDTPTTSISLTPLSGKTFLDLYTSTPYAVSVTGISNSANYSHTITSTGGQITSTTGGGVFTFATPMHKDNLSITRRVSTLTTFNRPASVTGTAYTASLTASDNINATFSYPSFWIFTIGTPSPPTASDIITASNFSSSVTNLGNGVNSINTFINNTSGSPKGFWFAIFSSVSQPTVFKTGSGPSLLSDVSVTRGNTVSLAPIPSPSGYIPALYTLYGITLQNGSSYISIS